MKIETLPREDHQMTMVVELETEQMESARRKAARRIAEKVNIPGFRRGKAPYEIVRRLYGDNVLNEEAVEILVEEIYPKALEQAGLKPAVAGSLENIESLEPPKFVFNVPLVPTVELGDYRSIRLPYEWTAPDESKVEEEIEQLRQMHATSQTVERPAQEGDYVLVAVTGRKAQSAEDEDAVLLERPSYAVVVRAEPKASEWPFPGFSRHLTGAKPGDVVEFTHVYPEDFEEEALKGQTVHFTVTVKSIRGVTLPELTDEFAQKTGLGQTVEELRQNMREIVNRRSQSEYDDEYFEKLLDQIKAGATIKYPPQVLEHEVEHVLEDVDRRLRQQGIEGLEKYLELTGLTREKFIEEQARPVAQKRLERSLVIDELVHAENIEPDLSSVEQEFQQIWYTLANTDEEFARRTKSGSKPVREIVDAVAMDSFNRVLTRRVLERIKAIANGEADKAETEAKADVEADAATDVKTDADAETDAKKQTNA